MEVLGWVASILLALSALPQAVKVTREGNAEGTSGLFLFIWWTGMVLMTLYVWLGVGDLVLQVNTAVSLAIISWIGKVKLSPGR